MSTHFDQKRPTEYSRERKDSTSSTDTSLKVPRTPRFAEATSVCSPVDNARSPFADPPSEKTQSYMAQSQPSDIGFGYIADNSRHVEVPMTPASPLRSAMRIPGTPARKIDNPLSPTFREEQVLEKHEGLTEKEQAKDLKIKTRVRVAKFVLRGVNFSCSLIILALLSTTLTIFNTTKHLPARNTLPPWANNTKVWPQYVVLSIACVSMAFCILIFWNYFRGGHKRAEKVAVYYTLFAMGFFIFSIIMWAVAAGLLQSAKTNGKRKDIWGWSCVDGKRKELFSKEVDYALVCRMQSWAVVCSLIEIVLECICVILYGVVFYRYYSKQRLRKSMDVRDRARSDLYLAQLRSQSAPNTPGFGPLSPSYSQHAKSPFPASYQPNPQRDAEEGFAGAQFAEAKSNAVLNSKPFALQPPPIKVHAATPKTPQNGFEIAPRSTTPPVERRIDHVDAAPGEQQYASVPIPGSYSSPINSPGLPPTQHQFASVGQAFTNDRRIESPPGSPRGFR